METDFNAGTLTADPELLPVGEQLDSPCLRIYVVIALLVDQRNGSDIQRQKALGWFPTFRAAENAVLENQCDMFDDGAFNMAVVIELPPGLFSLASRQDFYEVLLDEDRNISGILKTSVLPEKLKLVVFTL
jgi:hypothetical protein